MSPLDAVHEVALELGEVGVPSPRVDAELLVADVLGVSRSELYASDRSLDARELGRLRELVGRRRAREPLAYVLGEWGFRRLTLAVDARALVPRPETEVVVERCLAHLRELEAPRVLDVGTGSGAIALAIADEHPAARVVAVERSPAALALARENLARSALADRVELRLGDLLDGVAGPFDLVVSNPPYVAAAEFDSLQPEIRLYEPYEAVVGDRVWERIAGAARGVLAPGGHLVLECGDGQAPEVAEGLAALGYEGALCTPDLAGRDRVVEARRPEWPRPSARHRDTSVADTGCARSFGQTLPDGRARHGRVPGTETWPEGTGVSDDAVAALRAGQLVVLPTDTVYGLCADAYRERPCLRLFAAKRRPETMPVQLVAADLDTVLDAVPEARGRGAVVARALLPGPYTLILPNPARRFRWLTGTRPETIGVRVPALPPEALAVVQAVGAIAATSANLHGEPDPARVEDVPVEIAEGCGAVVDAGELPGKPSTVLDLTGPEPSVLREGLVPAEETLSAAAAALAAAR